MLLKIIIVSFYICNYLKEAPISKKSYSWEQIYYEEMVERQKLNSRIEVHLTPIYEECNTAIEEIISDIQDYISDKPRFKRTQNFYNPDNLENDRLVSISLGKYINIARNTINRLQEVNEEFRKLFLIDCEILLDENYSNNTADNNIVKEKSGVRVIRKRKEDEGKKNMKIIDFFK